jgi:hypothetical protein
VIAKAELPLAAATTVLTVASAVAIAPPLSSHRIPMDDPLLILLIGVLLLLVKLIC